MILICMHLMIIIFLEINTLLEEIATFSYPTWLASAAPHLPKLDLSCAATSGMKFLNDSITNSTSATITGFMNAIKVGCSNEPLFLVLSGGYDYDNQELEINMVFDIHVSRNL